MSKKHGDWIPHKELELVDLINTWIFIIGNTANQALYGWDNTVCTTLIADLVSFLGAREAYHETPTTRKKDEKNEAMAYGIDKMRVFARESIRFNQLMTDAQKHELGVSAQDTEPSPVIIPRLGPASSASISAKDPGVVYIRYLGAKPEGVERIEIAHAFLDAPPGNITLLTGRESFTQNPWRGDFPLDRNKPLYYSLRYLGAHNQASDWSAIEEVTVP
jgi:hypothetical protein